MSDGDSIWIHNGDRVGDVCKDDAGNIVTNFQNNSKNIKRRLYVERRLLPFKYFPVAVSPLEVKDIDNDKYIIPCTYIELFKQQGIFNSLKLTESKGSKYNGMIINIVPDDYTNVFKEFRLKGTLTILDPVGNRLIEKKRMGWDDVRKRLIFAWNVKNSNGRYVGPGMYVCLFEVEEITEGAVNTHLKEVMKLIVGVK